MNTIFLNTLCIIALLILISSKSYTQLSDDAKHDANVFKSIGLKYKFKNYLKPRLGGRQYNLRIKTGDINNDGLIDGIVDYCIESLEDYGGNAPKICDYEGIAVYLNDGDGFKLVLDIEKGMVIKKELLEGYDFKVELIEDGRIYFIDYEYEEDDGYCCPTIRNKIFLIYNNNELMLPYQEVKRYRVPVDLD